MAATVSGSSNITIHVCGNNDTVTVCQRPAVRLFRPQPRMPAHEREVLFSHLESIPFTARQPELARLDRWLSAEETTSVLAIIGAGGSGKTRLAMELFRLYEEAWSVGFLTSFQEPNSLVALPPEPPSKRPLLAVVDYAASHTEDLRKFLEDLAQHGTPLPKVRILLLERHADPQSGWYQRLFNYSQTAYTAGLFAQREPILLSRVSETADRRAIFESTLDASASFHGQTPRPELPSGNNLLDKPDLADPLVLMMAALASWGRGIYGALKLSRPDLALELARHERTRLEKRSKSELLPHMAAHSTLCGGFAREGLLKAAREETEALGLEYAGGPGQLARDLSDLLPGTTPGASGVILPDIIGEAFVLEVNPDGIARAAHRQGDALVRTLTRTLQDFYDPHEIRGSNQSGIDGSQAVTWLRELAADARAGDVDLLRALDDNLPDSSLELAPLAAEVTESLLRILTTSDAPPERIQEERARLLNNYGIRLRLIGRPEAALEAACESVEIRRKLAAARHDAFLPDLAMSLSNYGTCLGELGRRGAAQEAAREAVEICRDLVAARPDAFLPDLAGSLNNYACRLSETGHREAALEAAREAVEIHRNLAAVRPDAFLPKSAGSLSNYGACLGALGQREAAMETAREAVEIYRELAAARPSAFLPDLARSLAVMARVTGNAGESAALLHQALESLLPLFLQLPRAHERLMGGIAADYIKQCQQLNSPPDPELLRQINPVLETLQNTPPGASS